VSVSYDRICIVGAGAIGSVFASKLYEKDPDRVFLLAYGDRYSRLAKGLIVNGVRYRIQVMTPEEAPISDLILVAVKHRDLDGAIHDMKNAVGEDTVLLSLMNGIRSEEKLAQSFGASRTLYGLAIGIDAVRSGNTITYTHQGKVQFGEADNTELSERVRVLQELFTRARISHEIPRDMLKALWIKFMINVGINQVSAILGAPYRVFQRPGPAMDLVMDAMDEVISIAERKKIPLSREDARTFMNMLQKLSPEGKTSMLQDLEAGRETEVDMFAGDVVEMGKDLNIPTPVNGTLLKLIRVLEEEP
jgi:2-dehydropantoate 2-reductase